jgi:transcriptional regulator GlxA family with amidase domain
MDFHQSQASKSFRAANNFSLSARCEGLEHRRLQVVRARETDAGRTSQSHFSRVFRRVGGVTPSKCRSAL